MSTSQDPLAVGRVASFEDRYEHAACGLLALDSLDRVISANRTFAKWTGYTEDTLRGQRFTEVLTSSGQLFFETRCQPILRLKGELREVALTIKARNGEELAVLINADLIRDSTGNIVESRLAVFDSTVRQDYESELLQARRLAEASESRLVVLQTASALFATAGTEDSLAVTLAESARVAFAATDAAVVLYDDDGAMRVGSGRDLQDVLSALRSAAPPQMSPIVGTATIAIGNLDQAASIAPPLADALRAARFKALSTVPLVDDSTLLGALVLFYSREREFDDASLELHEALARQAAIVIVRARLQHKLEQLAMHDQLTGLANRNLLRERLSHAVAGSIRTLRPMALIFFDLDGFKPINDQLGHRVGDQVLQTIAARVNAVVRESDIVGRYGGDEFIICDNADAESARVVANRVLSAISDPEPNLPHTYPLSASVGIVVFNPEGETAPTNDLLFRRADAAMYASKAAGGNRVTLVEA